MAIGWVFFLAISIGHACLFVWILNVVHGLGINWRGMDRAVVIFLAVLGLASLVGEWKTATTPFDQWPIAFQAYAWFCSFLSIIFLPLTTLFRVLRRRPTEAKPIRSEEVDFAKIKGADSLIGRGRNSWCLRLPGHEAFRVRFDEFDVFLADLPEAFDGLSIVHLTDFHFAPCFERHFFESVLERVSLWDTDVIAFTGDLVDHNDAIAWIDPVFAPLYARLGKFAILGNHDVHHNPERISQELERAGFQMIDGIWTTVRRDGEELALGGTSAPWGPRLDWNARPTGLSSVVLSHSPDLFPNATAAGIDLMLSGHNHGGQIRLPVIGPVLMPSKYGRRFDLDFFRSGRSLLYVGRGLAGKHPLRYGCLPEVTRLTLRVASKRSALAGSGRDAFAQLPDIDN
ncbi:MAG: metallophosphoesterase [Isosphaeraceae bacterium]